MINPSLVDAMFDTTATATAALRSMEGQPFSAKEYIRRWQELDDIATGRRRRPIRVVATVRQAIEA